MNEETKTDPSEARDLESRNRIYINTALDLPSKSYTHQRSARFEDKSKTDKTRQYKNNEPNLVRDPAEPSLHISMQRPDEGANGINRGGNEYELPLIPVESSVYTSIQNDCTTDKDDYVNTI